MLIALTMGCQPVCGSPRQHAVLYPNVTTLGTIFVDRGGEKWTIFGSFLYLTCPLLDIVVFLNKKTLRTVLSNCCTQHQCHSLHSGCQQLSLSEAQLFVWSTWRLRQAQSAEKKKKHPGMHFTFPINHRSWKEWHSLKHNRVTFRPRGRTRHMSDWP